MPESCPRAGQDLGEVQALVFDTYGTVVDWRSAVLEALLALGRARGLDADWEAVLRDWEPRPIMDRVNRGELPWMTMEAIHRQALAYSIERHGIARLTAGESDELVRARWRLTPWPDAVPGRPGPTRSLG